MVGKAKPESVKTKISRQAHDVKLGQAVQAYLLDQLRPREERKGSRTIAKEYGVCYKTVERQANGGVSISNFNATKQKLTPAQERVLVEYLQESARRSFALNHTQLRQEASVIYKESVEANVAEQDPLGQNWVDRFLLRHMLCLAKGDLETNCVRVRAASSPQSYEE